MNATVGQSLPSGKSDRWLFWEMSGGHPDFPEQPPLLQVDDTFSEQLESWSFLKCQICKLVCPFPHYSCDEGHLLCFSCASVQPDSMCPMLCEMNHEGENGKCKRILKALEFQEFKNICVNTYPCPFKKLGCTVSDLLPAEVFEHAQKMCKFRRYMVKCFDNECVGSKPGVHGPFFASHLRLFHGARFINLEHQKLTKDQILIEYNYSEKSSKDTILIPVVFDGKSGYELCLLLRRLNGNVYFWIYQVMEHGSPKMQAKMCLRANKLSKKNVFGYDVIHFSTVSNEEVIKSGRCIQVSETQLLEDFIVKYPRTTTPLPYGTGRPFFEEIKFCFLFVRFLEDEINANPDNSFEAAMDGKDSDIIHLPLMEYTGGLKRGASFPF